MVQASSVEIRHVDKFYGPFQALKDVSLSIPAGKVTCLIGPSGSGKSTLLRCINALETINGGDLVVDGISVRECRSRKRLKSKIGRASCKEKM